MQTKSKYSYRVIIGYLSMILGICLPLISFLFLSFHELQANYFYEEFLRDIEQQTAEKIDNIKDFQKNYQASLVDNDGRYIDPFEAENYTVEYNLKNQDKDLVFAYLSIPKIDLKQPIRLGATAAHLNMGAAHVDGTALPVGGNSSRTVIAGHRGMYNNLMFLNLHELEVNDEATIQNILGQTLVYKVRDKKIVNSSAWNELLPEKGKDLLTLMTCDPWVPPSPNRLLITLERETKNKALDSSTKQSALEQNNGSAATSSTQNQSILNSIRLIKYAIFIITIFLFILLIYILRKFYRYLKTNRTNVSE